MKNYDFIVITQKYIHAINSNPINLSKKKNMIKIEKTNTIFAYYKKMPEDKNLQTFDSITKVVLIFALYRGIQF